MYSQWKQYLARTLHFRVDDATNVRSACSNLSGQVRDVVTGCWVCFPFRRVFAEKSNGIGDAGLLVNGVLTAARIGASCRLSIEYVSVNQVWMTSRHFLTLPSVWILACTYEQGSIAALNTDRLLQLIPGLVVRGIVVRGLTSRAPS